MSNEKNNLILKYGLIIVMLCFIISTVYYMQFSLDEFVFLKHYYERDIHDGSYMNIHFIKNTADNRKIIEIKFPEMPNEFASVFLNDFSNGFNNGYYRTEEFAHYMYNELVIEFRYNDINYSEEGNEESNEESIILNKAVIVLNNGDEQEVDIGKIVLHKNMNYYDFLETSSSSSSNDFTSTSVMTPIKDVVIDSIESNLDGEANGFMELTLNGVKIEDINFPLKLNSDDSLVFNNTFLYNTKDTRKYNVYDIQKRILVTDSEGNKGYETIHNLDYYPIEIFLSEKGIGDFLKYRGVK
ncbi:hypothetical protein J2Z76_003106 [Sedimentibacter acidaminivorans]|uniref:Uncharacterized protein n=1 Tax=Sedimentibacter acidaminivorans TaxID=913099 RepID=A0ABS4GHN4_9FIRM|nr:hypothetical protein [Sedimentibacter acidaminivorans]MBP1927209.1 hypothetical protein [Sedimentibacter acidaminivorans]